MQSGQHVRYAVLIPAYRPSAGLIDLVRDLTARGVPAIVVVDDGSGAPFRGIFDQAAQLPNVQVLRHAVNQGKGAALKTGINYSHVLFPGLAGVITADADGQHHPEDIERVAASLLTHPDSLVLGVRTFDDAVPLRSRFGNILTRRLMQALVGTKLQDTQTGLRGIPLGMFERLLRIEARGYEFELEMLIAARQMSVPVVEEPIRTIYEPGNKSSHFNPLTDSMKIYFVLLRFSSVSLITALLDNLVFYFVWKKTGFVLESQVAGRVVAVIFNYSMVRKTVFASEEGHQVLLPRYLLLVASSGTASYLGIQFLTSRFGVNAMPAKLFVETLLFFVNFAIQRMFIFREARPGGGKVFARLILLVLAAVIALELYGLRTSHVFAQEIWEAAGKARAIWFAALYAGVSTALLIMVPWLFVPLAVVLIAGLTVIFLGPATAGSVALFLVSAWSLGRLLGRRLKHSAAVDLLLGIAVYIFILPFAVRVPVNYWWTYAIVLAIPILANLSDLRRELPAILLAPARCEFRSWSERLGFAVLLFLVITHWFAMLKPEASADGLAMHLAIPANIAAHHALTFEPGRFLWAVMPMGADFTYSVVYLLGGEMASRLLNFTILLALLAMLVTALRRWVSPGIAWLLATLFASTPMVQLVTGSLFVENLLSAMIFGAMLSLWNFGESGERRFLYTAATLGGTAMAIKFGAIAFVVPGVVYAAVEVRRFRREIGSAWLPALALLLIAAAPPYAMAWFKTGNPLFPFLNDKLHSRLLDPKADIQDNRFRHPLTWNVPYDLTFRSNRHYEGQDGSFGFQYLLLAPMALLALLVVQRRQAVSASFVALTAIVLILRSEPNARYLYPALPLLSVPFAALLGWALANQRVMARALIAFTIAAVSLNAYFLPGSSYYHKDFYGPFTDAQRREYLGRTAPIRKAIAWINENHPKATVLLTQDSSIAGFVGEVFENHWHQYNTLTQIRSAGGMEDVHRLLEAWKVEYLIARKPTTREYARPAALRDVLANCTVPEYSFTYYYVARLEAVCKALAPVTPLRPVLTAGRGVFDDIDPYILFRGDWDRGDTFDGAFDKTVAYTDTAGAEAAFAFEGDALTYVYTKAPNRGIAAISIDGVSKGKFDFYGAAIKWQSKLRFEGLGAGRHLFLIHVTGESRREAQGTFVDLDALAVK
jgi:glycosyltransferase involved in cell wall biosynthesis